MQHALTPSPSLFPPLLLFPFTFFCNSQYSKQEPKDIIRRRKYKRKNTFKGSRDWRSPSYHSSSSWSLYTTALNFLTSWPWLFAIVAWPCHAALVFPTDSRTLQISYLPWERLITKSITWRRNGISWESRGDRQKLIRSNLYLKELMSLLKEILRD